MMVRRKVTKCMCGRGEEKVNPASWNAVSSDQAELIQERKRLLMYLCVD